MTSKTKTKEPLIRISKRTDVSFKTGILVRAVAILLALIVCGIVTKIFTGDDPLSIFKTIVYGAFGEGRLLVTIHEVAILLCVSLAVTPAFRMRFWNIGAEGQVLMGALSTAMCMFYLGGKVPEGVLILIMTVCAIVSAAIWAAIPAFFKAHWGTNETLFTLMMNYVVIQLIEYFLKIADKSGSNVVGPDLLSHGWFPQIFHTNYLLNILIVVAMTVILYIYLKYSKHGYEIAVVGESQRTASYAGIKVDRVIIRTMILSGSLCAMMGFLMTSGIDHTLTTTIVDSRGFTAVMVSWMSKFNPFIMIAASLLLVTMDRGASEVSSSLGLNHSFADILTGFILFFIIATEFFITYKVTLRKSSKKEA